MNLKYKDETLVTEHLNTFQGLLNQLTTMEMKLDDKVHALILLSFLPIKLGNFCYFT